MSVICTSCNGLHWIQERVSRSSITLPKFETCCKKGDVRLDMLQPPPPYLQYPLDSMDTVAHGYRARIREYNSALSFTSVKCQPDNRPEIQGGGI